VRITLLPSSADGTPQQFLTTLLVDDAVALDAGAVGLYGTPAQQAGVRHVLLSHSHIDHLASLPVLLNNILAEDGSFVTVHGSEAVLDCLRRDVFNDRLWPDFVRLSELGRPFLRLAPLAAGQPVCVEGLRITPVEVNHVVPTFGFVVEDGAGAVVYSADTGPTEALWEAANRTPNLKAVFLEVTFPDELTWLAELSRHLVPAQLAAEVRKLHRQVHVLAIHLHARWRAEIIRQLKALNLPGLQVAQFGVPYDF
jgi:ribonuclease BN (tRNA processing enzyme)